MLVAYMLAGTVALPAAVPCWIWCKRSSRATYELDQDTLLDVEVMNVHLRHLSYVGLARAQYAGPQRFDGPPGDASGASGKQINETTPETVVRSLDSEV
jgi:hypothetical protein